MAAWAFRGHVVPAVVAFCCPRGLTRSGAGQLPSASSPLPLRRRVLDAGGTDHGRGTSVPGRGVVICEALEE